MWSLGQRGANSETGITKCQHNSIGGSVVEDLATRNRRFADQATHRGRDLSTDTTVPDALNALALTNRCIELFDETELEIPSSLIYIDLDGLREVNSTRGHAEGNEYLRQFVQFCKQHLREEDFVGRIGGDEFVVVLYGTPAEKATMVMARLQRLSEGKFPFSFGVGESSEGQFEELMKMADERMYLQKNVRKRFQSTNN